MSRSMFDLPMGIEFVYYNKMHQGIWLKVTESKDGSGGTKLRCHNRIDGKKSIFIAL